MIIMFRPNNVLTSDTNLKRDAVSERTTAANDSIEKVHPSSKKTPTSSFCVRTHNDLQDGTTSKFRCPSVKIPNPVPIDEHKLRIILSDFPMSESNLVNEGDDFAHGLSYLFRTSTTSSSSTTTGGKKRKTDQIVLPDPLPIAVPSSSSEVANKSHGSTTKRRRLHHVHKEEVSPLLDHRFQQRPSITESVKSSGSFSDESNMSTNTTSAGGSGFRSYQSNMWMERFQELCTFAKTHGHCVVPNNYKNEGLSLSKWVKRQRYQMKLKKEGKHSTLTSDRQKALDDLGFIWDSHSAVWEEHLQELKQFKANHGHCSVPSTYSENHSLSIWVQCQRRQYKIYRNYMMTTTSNSSSSSTTTGTTTTTEKKGHGMSQDRITKLEELGFVWDPRNRSSYS